jgi:hypothetical protein
LSDGSIERDGFYLDDFVIRVVRPVGTSPVTTPQRFAARIAAYPNPFNPQTTVRFTNPQSGRVEIAIYDATGRRVRRLISGELAAGEHRAVWDGRGDDGRAVGSGLYFARLRAQTATTSVKLMLVK